MNHHDYDIYRRSPTGKISGGVHRIASVWSKIIVGGFAATKAAAPPNVNSPGQST
jgi:hypothetical protein